ncbi:MAG TPA: zinc ribbon domain-containing protein [Rhodocyclaceae bacterium]|nr:zinc ribbon domain-containing protein [Rhodocyclaceae bacterium]
MGKRCQSCGMPMKQDPQGGGDNADGTKNPDYCSYCYRQGAFVQPDFSARQMQDFCMEKLREMRMPKLVAWALTRGIPGLERWKK